MGRRRRRPDHRLGAGRRLHLRWLRALQDAAGRGPRRPRLRRGHGPGALNRRAHRSHRVGRSAAGRGSDGDRGPGPTGHPRHGGRGGQAHHRAPHRAGHRVETEAARRHTGPSRGQAAHQRDRVRPHRGPRVAGHHRRRPHRLRAGPGLRRARGGGDPVRAEAAAPALGGLRRDRPGLRGSRAARRGRAARHPGRGRRAGSGRRCGGTHILSGRCRRRRSCRLRAVAGSHGAGARDRRPGAGRDEGETRPARPRGHQRPDDDIAQGRVRGG